MFKKTLILLSLGLFFVSCGEDVTYRQKYIELLESHLVKLGEASSDDNLEEQIIISEDEVRRQAEKFYIFLCGDLNRLLDVRLVERAPNNWYILYNVKSSEIDDIGFEIEKSFTISAIAMNGKIDFEESSLKLDLCE
jgi:hypothetical protein|tara:strand:- start:5290 stop:5700 length:411 start_codon:yes stop_codon:yes gene_type:complete